MAIRSTRPSILHVGYPKSASTTLQRKLFANLPQYRYISRRSNGATDRAHEIYDQISNCLLREGSIAVTRKTLENHTRGDPYIFSDERLLLPYGHSATPLFARASLARAIFGDVRVLMVLRQPGAQIRSLYRHVSITAYRKGELGKIVPMDEWIGDLSEAGFYQRGNMAQGLHFGKLAMIYAQLFGRENLVLEFLENIRDQGAQAYDRIAEHLKIDDVDTSNIGAQNVTRANPVFEQMKNDPRARFAETLDTELSDRLSDIIRSETELLEAAAGISPPDSWGR